MSWLFHGGIGGAAKAGAAWRLGSFGWGLAVSARGRSKIPSDGSSGNRSSLITLLPRKALLAVLGKTKVTMASTAGWRAA